MAKKQKNTFGREKRQAEDQHREGQMFWTMSIGIALLLTSIYEFKIPFISRYQNLDTHFKYQSPDLTVVKPSLDPRIQDSTFQKSLKISKHFLRETASQNKSEQFK